jgi:exopolysaccharide biosynthesis polyprenyl glycosylphosphotransferase
MITKRETKLSRLMILVQVVITMLLFLVVEFFFPKRVFSLFEDIALLVQIALVWTILFNKFRLGVIFRANPFESMIRGYLVTVSFGSALLLIELGLFTIRHRIENSVKYLILFGIIDLVVLILFKVVFYYTMRYLRAKGHNSRIIIIIANSHSLPFVDAFIKGKDWGYRIAAVLSPDSKFKTQYHKIHVVKNKESLKNFITRHPVDDIFYCLPLDDKSYDLEQLIHETEEIGVTLHIMQQDYLDNINNDSKNNRGFDYSFVTYSNVPQHYITLKIKDIIDIVFSVAVLLLASPLMVLIAARIKLEDKGPVFFKQERIGLNGRRFDCYKFRSMVTNAEELISELQEMNESDGPTFKIENDPRITKIGRILRKTSLDELPQFYNVIKGEMSVVGPRPPLLVEVQQYERLQLRRLSMKPGITCKWQVWGRNQVSFKEWMRMDLEYIDNWSLFLDFKIIFATIGVILKANGQ